MAHHLKVSQCWACTIVTDRSGKYQNSNRQLGRFALYEMVVEHLEKKPRGTVLRRPDICREIGPWPELWGIVNLVFQDMRLHGLMQCIKTDRIGKCCYEFVMVWD